MRKLRVLTVLAVLGIVLSWPDAPAAFGQTAAAAPDTSGIQITGEYGAFLPTDVSVDGHQIDQLINWLHIFMFALFGAWGVFFIYCLVRFRQRGGHRASCVLIKAKPSKYAEIGVAIFEAVILVGFAMPVWAAVKTKLPPAEDNPTRVRVLAEQFAWNFHYPGADGRFGKTAPQFVNTATNPLGLDRSDPDAQDDIYSGEMHIPTDKAVIAEISSKDVIHSFFLPVMRVKQDAIPGMRIPVWFKPHPEKSEGVYEVACAQLCGNNHYSMRALMYIEPREKYEAWLAEKSKPPEEFEE